MKEKRENSVEIDKLEIIIIIEVDELKVKCKKMCQYSMPMGPFKNIHILR